MTVSKDSFDAALLPGVREKLADVYRSLRQSENDVLQTMLDKYGEFREGLAHARDCPLCAESSRKASLIYHSNGMHIVQCARCDLVYSQEVINRIQDDSRYRQSNVMDAHMTLHTNEVYAALEAAKARYIISRLKGAGAGNRVSMLDIGCSTGSVLKAAKEVGWQAKGIDLNSAAVNIAQANGFDASHGRFPDDLPSNAGPFSAIAMLDVLEHVENPVEYLDFIVKRLLPDGLLAIQVPNLNSLLIRIEGTKNNNICHGHWSYFTAETLTRAAAKAGLRALSIETIISEIDRVRAYPVDQVVQVARNLTNIDVEFSNIDHRWIHEHLLGYKLLGIFTFAREETTPPAVGR